MKLNSQQWARLLFLNSALAAGYFCCMSLASENTGCSLPGSPWVRRLP